MRGARGGARRGAGGASFEGDVQEAWTCDVHGADSWNFGKASGKDLREVARCHAGLLAQLQRDVGCPVTVLTALGTVDTHGVWNLNGDFTSGDGFSEACGYCCGEFFRSHRSRIPVIALLT